MDRIGINYFFGEREFGDGFLTRDDVSPADLFAGVVGEGLGLCRRGNR